MLVEKDVQDKRFGSHRKRLNFLEIDFSKGRPMLILEEKRAHIPFNSPTTGENWGLPHNIRKSMMKMMVSAELTALQNYSSKFSDLSENLLTSVISFKSAIEGRMQFSSKGSQSNLNRI